MRSIKVTFMGVMVLLSFVLRANEKQDSLLKLLNNAENDSVKISTLLKLGMATSGETQCNYFKEAYTFDSLYNYKYLGYRPFMNLAILNLYNPKSDSVVCFLDKALAIATRDKDSSAIAKIYQVYGNFHLSKGDNYTSVAYTQKGRKLFENLKDTFNYYRLYNNEANIYLRMGKQDTAQTIFQTIIDNAVQPRDRWILASAHLSLGSIYTNESNYKNALDHQLLAYNIWKEMSDTINYCKALNNIGITYKKLSMYSLAQASFQEIIDANPKNDPNALPLAYANIANLYAHQNEFKLANQHIDRALEIMESIGNLYYIIALRNIKIDILIREDKYVEAKPIVEESLKTAKEQNYNEPYTTALYFYAKILNNTNQLEEALQFAKTALKRAKESDDKQRQFSTNYLIGKILSEMGQNEKASPYLLNSLELNDSIKKEEEDQDLLESALTYEIGKREAINEALKKETELNKTIIEKNGKLLKMQKAVIVIIAISFLFTLIFLIVIYRDNKVRKRLNNEVNDKNAKLNELLKIKNKILSVVSHDLKSPMVSLHNAIYVLRNTDISTEKKEEIFDSTEGQVKQAIELLEKLLNWAKTHEDGIQVKLEKINIYELICQNIKLAQHSIEEKELTITNECNKEMEFTADKNLIDIVVRNLLSNAIKFTQRKGTILIEASADSNETSISILDSGEGIDEEHIKKILSTNEFVSTQGTEKETGSGLGLKLCKNYVKYLNGELKIESKPGNGSKFTVTIPSLDGHKIPIPINK